MTVINSSTQYYLRKLSIFDGYEDGDTSKIKMIYEYHLFKDTLNGSSTSIRKKTTGSNIDGYTVISDSLNFGVSAESLFEQLGYMYNLIKNKNLMTHQSGYIYDLYTNYFVDYHFGNDPGENETENRIFGFFTGDLIVSPPLEMINKRAYLANFPVQFADDDDYKQCMLDFLNIIGSCLYNLYFKQNIYNSDVVLDNSSLVDILATISEILHDKELTQPILINQNNTENFASLENEDWNLNNDDY